MMNTTARLVDGNRPLAQRADADLDRVLASLGFANWRGTHEKAWEAG